MEEEAVGGILLVGEDEAATKVEAEGTIKTWWNVLSATRRDITRPNVQNGRKKLTMLRWRRICY